MGSEKKTAHETYRERKNDIAVLLDLIGQELLRDSGEEAKDPDDWGRAGDLGHVCATLKEVLVFLMGSECEEASFEMIEEHLEEMRSSRKK